MPSLSTTDESTADVLATNFRARFGIEPTMVRAPGRVNLIGEHTDYNYGFVMPVAIGFYTWVAAGRRSDRMLNVHSDQSGDTVELSLDSLAGPPRQHWGDFIRGVAAVLQSAGYRLSGANLMIHGQVPIGAGMSPSASLPVGAAPAPLSVAAPEATSSG